MIPLPFKEGRGSCNKHGEALEYVVQRDGGCPVLGDIQDQAARASEHPDQAVRVPVHCREVGLLGLQRFLPTQMIL